MVLVNLLESSFLFSCFFGEKSIIEALNVHKIRENIITNLHVPVTQIQLLLAYGQFYL